MKWPKEVPVIEAGDVCQGALTAGEKHCIVGWAKEIFSLKGWITEHYNHPVYKALLRVTGEDKGYVARWNDAPGRKLEEIADAINLATASLGYTEGNPMTKKLKAFRKKTQSS